MNLSASKETHAYSRKFMTGRLSIGGALCGVLLLLPHTLMADEEEPCPETVEAHAEIYTCGEEPVLVGFARLSERASKEGVKVIDISMRIEGMDAEPGAHAVHIHETASCTPCSSAKGHFDPGPHGFTNPDGNHPFHAGDLENIYLDDKGNGWLQVISTRVTLSPGPLSIFDEDGSSFIVHVEPDTYCPEGEAKGCAGGARAACGIIVKSDKEGDETEG